MRFIRSRQPLCRPWIPKAMIYCWKNPLCKSTVTVRVCSTFFSPRREIAPVPKTSKSRCLKWLGIILVILVTLCALAGLEIGIYFLVRNSTTTTTTSATTGKSQRRGEEMKIHLDRFQRFCCFSSDPGTALEHDGDYGRRHGGSKLCSPESLFSVSYAGRFIRQPIRSRFYW